MIIAEFNIESKNEAILFFDSRGIQDFIADNRFLVTKKGHNHLFVPSWPGDELSEKSISGKNYAWCSELTIIAADYHNEGLKNNDLQLTVEMTVNNRYTLTLGGEQEGIEYLLSMVSMLSSRNERVQIPLRRSIFLSDEDNERLEYKMHLVLQCIR